MTHSAFLRKMDKEGMVQPLGGSVEIPRVVLGCKGRATYSSGLLLVKTNGLRNVIYCWVW